MIQEREGQLQEGSPQVGARWDPGCESRASHRSRVSAATVNCHRSQGRMCRHRGRWVEQFGGKMTLHY